MGFYDKHIQYLDLWEYGEKVGNVGFAKIEAREGECRIWISVKGLYSTDVVVGQLFLLADEEEILADQFLIHMGMGTYTAKWDTQNLGQVGLTYEAWNGIRVKISEQRKVEKCWRREPQKEETKESALPKEEETEPKISAVEVRSEETNGETDGEMNGEQSQRNKWGRLELYYKKKKPFGDEREYLCISPEDLILLPEKYEHLYKNSFLLHGYYAYGHILLGAERNQNRTTYKLCIPGVGHDKERVVARLFGFGDFVPAMRVQENRPSAEARGMDVQQFGYYQMTVEL